MAKTPALPVPPGQRYESILLPVKHLITTFQNFPWENALKGAQSFLRKWATANVMLIHFLTSRRSEGDTVKYPGMSCGSRCRVSQSVQQHPKLTRQPLESPEHTSLMHMIRMLLGHLFGHPCTCPCGHQISFVLLYTGSWRDLSGLSKSQKEQVTYILSVRSAA